MMKKVAGACFVLAFALVASGAIVTPAHAETAASSNIASLIETLKSLMSKVASLQSQMQDVQKDIQGTHQDIKDAIKDGLKEGMTDDDIKDIQELLATDSDIYPQGLVTGYWGRLTTDALKRFQKKHDLSMTGTLDEETKDLIDAYLGQRPGTHFPTGFLRMENIFGKVHSNICKGNKGNAWMLFCKDWDQSDEDEDQDDDRTGDVDITIEDGVVTVAFTFEEDNYTATSSSTRLADVYETVADEIDEDVSDIPRTLKSEIRADLSKAVADMRAEARKALNAADDAIDEVQDDIDDADSDVDTDDAQEALDGAADLYDDARSAYKHGDYDAALSKAKDAKDAAEDAADLLEEAIDDAD